MISAVEIGFRSSDDDGSGAVGEEAGGDEIGDGLVIVLPGEGTEFDGEQKGDVFGEGANVVRSARDSGGSGDAAEAEDGSALDVYRERKAVDEAGVDGGAGDSGDGGEEDGVDVLGTDTGVIESTADGLLAEINGMSDPGVVCFSKGVECGVVLEGKDDVAEVDTTVGVEASEQAGLLHLVGPTIA